VRRGQRDRRGSGDVAQLPAEKGAGVEAVASRGAASAAGPSGRDARLLVAWGASCAECSCARLVAFPSFLPPQGWVVLAAHEPLAERRCGGGRR